MIVIIREFAAFDGTETDTKNLQSRRKIISFYNRLTKSLIKGILSVNLATKE
jgi:hypothetical protein